jgi:hypothetical protein
MTLSLAALDHVTAVLKVREEGELLPCDSVKSLIDRKEVVTVRDF